MQNPNLYSDLISAYFIVTVVVFSVVDFAIVEIVIIKARMAECGRRANVMENRSRNAFRP